MDVSVSDQEEVMKMAENAEEEDALKEVEATVSVSTSSTTSTSSAGGTGSRPSLSSSTPGSGVAGGALSTSIAVSPELLAQIQQLLISQGGAPAPRLPPAAAGLPPAVGLGVPGPSQSTAVVPVLPPGLLALAAPLLTMPRQAPAAPNVLLGAAMAASSPVLDLERLVANQAMMFKHQHLQARQAQLKAAEAKVVLSRAVLVTPENK